MHVVVLEVLSFASVLGLMSLCMVGVLKLKPIINLENTRLPRLRGRHVGIPLSRLYCSRDGTKVFYKKEIWESERDVLVPLSLVREFIYLFFKNLSQHRSDLHGTF